MKFLMSVLLLLTASFIALEAKAACVSFGAVATLAAQHPHIATTSLAGIRPHDAPDVKIGKTLSWLVFGGGIQLWADAAHRQGFLSDRNNRTIGDISCVIQRVTPVLRGEQKPYDNFATDLMQLQSLLMYLSASSGSSAATTTLSTVSSTLPAEWQNALSPLVQILQVNEAIMQNDPAVLLTDAHFQAQVEPAVQSLFTDLAPRIHPSFTEKKFLSFLANISTYITNCFHAWLMPLLFQKDDAIMQRNSSAQHQM